MGSDKKLNASETGHFERSASLEGKIAYIAKVAKPFHDQREWVQHTIAAINQKRKESGKLAALKVADEAIDTVVARLANRYFRYATERRDQVRGLPVYEQQWDHYDRAQTAFENREWEDCIYFSRLVFAACLEVINHRK